jgi:hypothetical protein
MHRETTPEHPDATGGKAKKGANRAEFAGGRKMERGHMVLIALPILTAVMGLWACLMIAAPLF